MNLLLVYLRLYGECLKKALQGISKNAWTLLLPIGLMTALVLAGSIASAIPLLGGILLALAIDALLSCYLYFVGEVVSNAKVQLAELKRSFGAYFWSVLNVGFVFFIANWLLSAALHDNPKAAYIQGVVMLAAAVLLNATPEVIYQRGTYGGLATLQESIQFVQSNWIEWLIPANLPLVLVYLFSAEITPRIPFGGILGGVISGALLHVGMVFRGHLFSALQGTSHRQRMFKYRNGVTPD